MKYRLLLFIYYLLKCFVRRYCYLYSVCSYLRYFFIYVLDLGEFSMVLWEDRNPRYDRLESKYVRTPTELALCSQSSCIIAILVGCWLLYYCVREWHHHHQQQQQSHSSSNNRNTEHKSSHSFIILIQFLVTSNLIQILITFNLCCGDWRTHCRPAGWGGEAGLGTPV